MLQCCVNITMMNMPQQSAASLPEEKETSTEVADLRETSTLSRDISSPSEAVLNQDMMSSSPT